MKITSIESFARREVALVRIRTESGEEGWGQTSPFNADFTAQVLHRMVAPLVLGTEIEDHGSLDQRVLEGTYKFPGSFVCRALTAVDTAIWDLLAKRAGKSVCELMGGKPGPVRAYGSSMQRGIKPRDEAERLRRLRDEKGFTAFKIRIGSVCGHDQDQWPGRTEELVPTVRKAVGDDVSILVDANSCYTAPKAIEVGNFMADYGVCHFEEPCPYWELDWTAEVARELEMPVAGGEQDYDIKQWERILGLQAVDIVQPDVCYVGGWTRAMRVADMAHRAGRPCVPHSANLSLVTLFTLHLMVSIPNAGPYVEFSIEDTKWSRGMYEPYLEVRDGVVQIPEGPGWGITVLPEWLEGSDYQQSTLDD